MYNTKAKFIWFTTLAILCIILMVVSALFYVEWLGQGRIFDIIPPPAGAEAVLGQGPFKDPNHTRRVAFALISIGFTLSAVVFCAAISIFAYYIIAAASNRKLIKYIRQLKDDYSIKHKIPKEEIDSGLLDIRAQIRKLEKDHVKPIKEVEVKKGKKEEVKPAAKPTASIQPTPVATAPFPAA